MCAWISSVESCIGQLGTLVALAKFRPDRTRQRLTGTGTDPSLGALVNIMRNDCQIAHELKRHAAYTEEILSRPGAFRDLAVVAAAHHERLDGCGYPRGVEALKNVVAVSTP